MAVNPVTNKIYVANCGSDNVTVITDAPDNDTRVCAAFNRLPGDTTSLARPTLTGKGVNRSTPGRNVMMGVGNRLHTAQSAWNWATITSGAGTDSVMWTYNWGTDSLIPGENFVCAEPLESDAGTTNNEGLGSPFAGNLLVYAMYCIPPDVGTDSVLRPVASFLTANSRRIPPLARIRNYGASKLGTFDVRLTVSPGSYSSTKTVSSLAAGATCTVEFDSLTLTTGVFTAKCATMLAGDLNPGNNARTSCFQGCTFINFFDLTNGGLTPDPPTGKWARGVPHDPWTNPPMDATVWGDRLSGNYDPSENSYLTSPTYKASQANPAIAFQHSFNTELYHDGGNFSYSTDNGSSWHWRSTCAGLPYNSEISVLGDSGWSGNSLGWKQSAFMIPVAANAEFKVRWHFAADGDGVTGPGWLIDEVAGINCDLPGRLGAAGFIDTMNVWPNPVRGKGQVSYTLRKACNVSIGLYDVSGRLAARVPTSGFRQGKNTAALDATKLARGVYFVKVKGETDTKTTKVIIE